MKLRERLHRWWTGYQDADSLIVNIDMPRYRIEGRGTGDVQVFEVILSVYEANVLGGRLYYAAENGEVDYVRLVVNVK